MASRSTRPDRSRQLPARGRGRALWALAVGRRELLKIAPTRPRPGLEPVAGRRPGVLLGRHLPAGRWRAEHFVVPLILEVRGDGWLAAPLREEILLYIAEEPEAAFGLDAPTIAFGRGGSARPVHTPRELI